MARKKMPSFEKSKADKMADKKMPMMREGSPKEVARDKKLAKKGKY